jgi:hypothetical protein
MGGFEEYFIEIYVLTLGPKLVDHDTDQRPGGAIAPVMPYASPER